MALTVAHIHDLLEEGAQALGYELVAVEMTGSDSVVLRLFIDSEAGITVEDCTKASHQFSAILDVADPIPNHYTLEVSSPGLDRPLAKPEHFQKVVGEKVKIRMSSNVDGRRRYTGVLISANDNEVVIDVDGQQSQLQYIGMDRARLVPVFD